MMQQLYYGQILGLEVRAGQPVLDPPPRFVRDVKLASAESPHLERRPGDFLLKQQVVELLAYFDQLQNGVIDVIEIKHGLPFRLLHTQPPA
jgi:hypothetical protein